MRSSGPGGQHANKVSSKVAVSFHVPTSTGLSEREKERLQLKLATRLSSEGFITLQCDTHRSQHKNKALVTERLLQLLAEALVRAKKRKPTKPSKSAIEKRLRTKKKASLKKANRTKPKPE